MDLKPGTINFGPHPRPVSQSRKAQETDQKPDVSKYSAKSDHLVVEAYIRPESVFRSCSPILGQRKIRLIPIHWGILIALYRRMAELRNGYLSSIILCLGLLLSLIANGLEMEYISPEKSKELEQLFAKSTFEVKKSESIKQKEWTCDMFGVRTRLQVQRGVKLYSFKKESWRNSGAQLVEDYKPESKELLGRADRFEDRLRVTDKGQLISQLTVTSPIRQVVAYSLCSTP